VDFSVSAQVAYFCARYFSYPSSIAVAPMRAVMYLNSVIEMLSFGA
jgi:hypothetical protein